MARVRPNVHRPSRPARSGRLPSPRDPGPEAGLTLLELLVVLVILGVVGALGAAGLESYRRAVVLDRAAESARGAMGLARMLAITRREVVKLDLRPGGRLYLRTRDGRALRRIDLVDDPTALDSARLRPWWMRYNPRGQASPGSLYLYAGDRGVRVVCNFIGRVRIERFGL